MPGKLPRRHTRELPNLPVMKIFVLRINLLARGCRDICHAAAPSMAEPGSALCGAESSPVGRKVRPPAFARQPTFCSNFRLVAVDRWARRAGCLATLCQGQPTPAGPVPAAPPPPAARPDRTQSYGLCRASRGLAAQALMVVCRAGEARHRGARSCEAPQIRRYRSHQTVADGDAETPARPHVGQDLLG